MIVSIKKTTSGKLPKGRDHKLDYTMVWKHNNEPVDLETDVDVMFLVVKPSDTLDDDEAVILLNSDDNPDQFIVRDADEGEGTFWIKKTDQDDIIPDTKKYCLGVVVVLSDGTEWPFIEDYNIVFSQPALLETGYEV